MEHRITITYNKYINYMFHNTYLTCLILRTKIRSHITKQTSYTRKEYKYITYLAELNIK